MAITPEQAISLIGNSCGFDNINSRTKHNDAITSRRPKNNADVKSSTNSRYKHIQHNSGKPHILRLADHTTWLYTWRDHGNPGRSINIAFTFVNGIIEPQIEQLEVDNRILDETTKEIKGEYQNFEVYQYIYNCDNLEFKDLNEIILGIYNIINGTHSLYIDPFKGDVIKCSRGYKMNSNGEIVLLTENSNYNNITMRNNNKALYESIMKDVAKVVKRKLNEGVMSSEAEDVYMRIINIAEDCFSLPAPSGKFGVVKNEMPPVFKDCFTEFKRLLRGYLTEYFEED